MSVYDVVIKGGRVIDPESATDKIAQAEARALEQIRADTVDMTIAATRRVIAESLDEARSGVLIDEAIAGLGKNLAS